MCSKNVHLQNIYFYLVIVISKKPSRDENKEDELKTGMCKECIQGPDYCLPVSKNVYTFIKVT